MTNELNPFDDAEQKASAATTESSIVLATVEAVNSGANVVAVSNVGKDAKYPARVPAENDVPPVGSSVLVNTAVGGQPFVQQTMDVPEGESLGSDSSTSPDLFLGPESEYVESYNEIQTNSDGSISEYGSYFIRGFENEVTPSSAGSITRDSYTWTGILFDGSDFVTFDFSNLSNESVVDSGSTTRGVSYSIKDGETGEILYEGVEVSNINPRIFSLNNTSGLITVSGLDFRKSRFAVSGVVETSNISETEWERPYSNLPNFATSGNGDVWPTELSDDGAKRRYSNVQSITSNFDRRYQFYAETTDGFDTAVDDQYVYVYCDNPQVIGRFDRTDKSIDWSNRISVPSSPDNPSLILKGGNIYATIDQDVTDVDIRVYDKTDGTELNNSSIDLDSQVSDSLSTLFDFYVHNGDFIFCAYGNNDTYVFRVTPSGSVVWTTEIPTNGNTPNSNKSCYSGSHVFIQRKYGSGEENLYSTVDLSDGSIIQSDWFSDQNVQSESPDPVYVDGNAYILTDDGSGNVYLFEYDILDGTYNINANADYPSGSRNNATMAVDDTHVYISDAGGSIVDSYQRSDLSLDWSADAGTNINEHYAAGDVIYTVHDNNIQKIAKSDQTVTDFGISTDTNNNLVAFFDNELYIVDNDAIHKYIELA